MSKKILEWDEYFMATAILASQRSKDPETRVGACIVNENNIIVGIGYNGMPRLPEGKDNDKVFPWGKDKDYELDDKLTYVCHAEMNAILNKNSADVKGCKIYVTHYPCNECAKLIVQSGIKEVIYIHKIGGKGRKGGKRLKTEGAENILDYAGIIQNSFDPKQVKVISSSTVKEFSISICIPKSE